MRIVTSKFIACMLLTLGVISHAGAEEYARVWGPPIGSKLPLLEAQDQTTELRRFSDLKGKRGLLLFMNRSADW